jgi:hypothetical protein
MRPKIFLFFNEGNRIGNYGLANLNKTTDFYLMRELLLENILQFDASLIC